MGAEYSPAEASVSTSGFDSSQIAGGLQVVGLSVMQLAEDAA